MAFLIGAKVLEKHLDWLYKVAPTKSGVLPIVRNVLFRQSGSQLQLVATDLENTLEVFVEVQDQGNAPVEIAAPAKLLHTTLKHTPEQPVTISYEPEQQRLTMVTQSGSYEVTGEAASDFPSVPEIEEGATLVFPKEVLKTAIDRVLFATSDDEHRPAMVGVFFDLTQQYANFVATNGHRLALYTRSDFKVEKEQQILIHKKSLKMLRTLIDATEAQEIQLILSERTACFDLQSMRFYCRPLDATFPDYKRVIRSESPLIAEVNREGLIEALKRVEPYTQRTQHLTVLSFNKEQLALQTQSYEEQVAAQEYLPCSFNGEETFEIGVNADHFKEMLNAIPSERVRLEFVSADRAVQLRPIESSEIEDTIMLIMPLTIMR